MKQLCLFLLFSALPNITFGTEVNTQSLTLVKQYCVSCHGVGTETSLDLESLSEDLSNAETFGTWVKIFDRLAAGEMPPQDAEQPQPERVVKVLKSLGRQLLTVNETRQRQIGRVPARRLTKLEYRYTLQDLLHISEDVTSIVFGSNLGNANSHDAHNLPIMLAGGGFNHGTYVAHNRDNNTELSNLFLCMLQEQGIEVDSFGQSTGTLSW